MGEYVNSIDIEASAEAVRVAVAEHGDRWWTTNAQIDASPRGFCDFRFPAAGFHASFRVVRNEAHLVEWLCIDAAHPRSAGHKNRREWIGSTVRFEIEPADRGTRLRLRHSGLDESLAHYVGDSDPWRFYLSSIKKVAETGAGDAFAGGRPGTQSAGLITMIITFKVAPDKQDEATAAIRKFIAAIEANEPDTIAYRSYRHADDPTSFTHYMAFRTEDARTRHSASAHCGAFRDRLYPLCTEGPSFFPAILVDEAAR